MIFSNSFEEMQDANENSIRFIFLKSWALSRMLAEEIGARGENSRVFTILFLEIAGSVHEHIVDSRKYHIDSDSANEKSVQPQ